MFNPVVQYKIHSINKQIVKLETKLASMQRRFPKTQSQAERFGAENNSVREKLRELYYKRNCLLSGVQPK